MEKNKQVKIKPTDLKNLDLIRARLYATQGQINSKIDTLTYLINKELDRWDEKNNEKGIINE